MPSWLKPTPTVGECQCYHSSLISIRARRLNAHAASAAPAVGCCGLWHSALMALAYGLPARSLTPGLDCWSRVPGTAGYHPRPRFPGVKPCSSRSYDQPALQANEDTVRCWWRSQGFRCSYLGPLVRNLKYLRAVASFPCRPTGTSATQRSRHHLSGTEATPAWAPSSTTT